MPRFGAPFLPPLRARNHFHAVNPGLTPGATVFRLFRRLIECLLGSSLNRSREADRSGLRLLIA
jgi:hypothetical protein